MHKVIYYLNTTGVYRLDLTKSSDDFFPRLQVVDTLQNSQVYHERQYRTTSQIAKGQDKCQICVFSCT